MPNAVRNAVAAVRNPQLRRLQLAFTASVIGGCAYIVALAVIAFRADGPGAVGLLLLLRTLAAAVASPPLSTLGDRYPRRAVMATSEVLAGLLIAGMAIVVARGGPVAIVYLLAVMTSVAVAAFRPAEAALVPQLARTPEELTAANALSSTIEGAGFFAGPAIGGLILAASGPAAVLIVCAATSAVSAMLIWSVTEPPRVEATAAEREAAEGMAAGLRVLRSLPGLRAVTVTYAAQAMVAGALVVLEVSLAIDVLGLGNAGVGYLESASGVGAVIGGVLAVGLSGTRRLAAAFAVGALAWGGGVALLGAAHGAVFAVVVLAGIGLGNSIVDVAAVTLLQRSAPDAVLGRVFGALESVLIAAVGVGAVLAPVLIHVVGVRLAFAITGAVLLVAVAANLRAIATLDRVPAEVAELVALLRAHPVFAPLRDATLEQLARRLEPVEAPAGEVVVRQGDPGDHVYVVRSGALEVSVDGKPGAPLGPGDLFGEIALLRDTPRTATVTAASACELMRLAREDFLAAVTGHATSRAEADLIVTARLGALRPELARP